MTRLELVRWAALLVPLGAGAAALRLVPFSRREHGALLFAFLAAFVGLGVLHELASLVGWWSYAEVAGTWRGLPVDLWLGWAVLWGPLPVALRRSIPLPLAVVAAAWLDVVAMPALAPVVELHASWLVGEVVGLVLVLVPAVLLGRWLAERQRLAARTVGQLLVFAGLVGWLLPTTVFELADGSWSALFGRPGIVLAGAAQLAVLLALPGVAAVQELAQRGGGTPYPWDPPDRLVTTGPYAFVENPMQWSGTALLLLLAALSGSWALAGAAIGATAFASTVARPHEHEHLRRRFGAAHDRYRTAVRPWVPRWRPDVTEPGRLVLDGGCPRCRELGAAIRALEPDGLLLLDAREDRRLLQRARYDHPAGGADGLGAIGRALNHAALPWAALGWLLQLPVVRPALQVVADVVGPPPHAVGGSPEAVGGSPDALGPPFDPVVSSPDGTGAPRGVAAREVDA
jgi:protein-S-isoprenylcysteine O-methyltransferase Ste14